jgi:hypothetical protein
MRALDSEKSGSASSSARAQMDVPSMSDKELQAIVRKKLLGANVFQ